MLDKILQFIASEITALKNRKRVLVKTYTASGYVVPDCKLKSYTITKVPLVEGYTRRIVNMQLNGTNASLARIVSMSNNADGTIDFTILNQPRKTGGGVYSVGSFSGSVNVTVLYIPTEDHQTL